jgi:hypothetical protein
MTALCHPWHEMAELSAVRLLGHLEIEARGLAHPLYAPERRLLICLLLAPNDRAKWEALRLTGKDLSRAKNGLRGLLGDEWVDPAARVYRLRQRPWVDIENLPIDDADVFAYACERGSLLEDAEFADIDWTEELRHQHRQATAAVAARLIDGAPTPAAAERVLEQARRVLTPSEIEALGPARVTVPPVVAVEERGAEGLLRSLEAEVADPTASAARIVPRLDQLVGDIECAAIAWRPYPTEVLERASVIVGIFRRSFGMEIESFVWRLANARMYASDISGAFAELRPWVEDPLASPGILCIAGLLNQRVGWVDAAHKTFTAALELTPVSPFAIVMREKRDVQLAQDQGENRSALAHQLRDNPLFDELSTGGRASVYCNEAKTTLSPINALRLYQKARDLDLAAENPHYELNVVRAAVRVGNADLATRHLMLFNEMLQTQNAISLHYARLEVEGERLVQQEMAATPRRAPLERAGAVYEALAEGHVRGGAIARACSAWLKRIEVAQALGRPEDAFFHARVVTLISAGRCERYQPAAHSYEASSRARLGNSVLAQLEDAAAAKVRSIVRGLPSPLLPHASQAR